MKIIINADDFGRSENVNKAILNLHLKGVLSSATLMANGESFYDAVRISSNNPKLGIGVHLCLDGPFNIGNNYNSIIDKTTGHFYNNHQVISKLKRFDVNREEIFKEYCLQIEKVLDHKIKVTHLDHHHHLHLYLPALLSIIKASKKYKIPHIRTQKLISRVSKGLVNKLVRNIHHSYLNLNVSTTDAYFETGLKSEKDFDSEYKRLVDLFKSPVSAVEIVLHPISENDPETLFYSSELVRSLLHQQSIVNYGTLK